MSKRFKKPNIKDKNLSSPNIKEKLVPKIDIRDNDEDFLVCFSHLDCNNQWQSLQDAENCKMLSKTIETIKWFTRCPPHKAANIFSDIFTIYWDFPQKQNTDFSYPNHITRDARWAKLRLSNKYHVIGHIVWNVFYVVFFDSEHKFWKTEPRNT